MGVGTAVQRGGGVMSQLVEAIRLIQQQITVRRARCVIADDGCPDESSLLGTRDGYLNLALALLAFVADADEGKCWQTGDRWPSVGHHWDGRIKNALYQLPRQARRYWWENTFSKATENSWGH
jgi:hypothetical protein